MSKNFGQRMLAKMGHVEGQGLGRSGSGITAPIEAVTTHGRRGIGHEDGLVPASAYESTQSSWGESDITSKFIRICNLDDNIGAATVYQLFEFYDYKPKEIIICSPNTAYAEFKTEQDAETALADLSGEHFGQISRKLYLEPIAPENFPDQSQQDESCGPTLSVFLKQQAENTSIKSRTVLATHLGNHALRYIKAMWGDLEDVPYTDIRVTEPGVALIKFDEDDDAAGFVHEWNGSYFKTRTVYAKCVPDSEMEDILAKANSKPKGAVHLRNVPAGATEADVRDVLFKYEIDNVALIPKGGAPGTAIVFLNAADAEDILQKYPNGLVHQKRKYYVAEYVKGAKGKRAAAARQAQAATPYTVNDLASRTANLSIATDFAPRSPSGALAHSHDVIVKNLSYQAADQDVRHLFNGFTVSRIAVQQGRAFVGLPSIEEQQRAVRQLNERKVLGRKVFVEAARPRN